MAKTSDRKLFLFGKYSLALLPPKKWLQEMGVEIGDTAHLEFDRARQRIVVRFTANTAAPAQPTPKKKSDSDDWQPIPQL